MILNQFSGLSGVDLAKEVSTVQKYLWSEGTHRLIMHNLQNKSKYKIIAYDFGIKNILRILIDLGCEVSVVPATYSYKEVLNDKPMEFSYQWSEILSMIMRLL